MTRDNLIGIVAEAILRHKAEAGAKVGGTRAQKLCPVWTSEIAEVAVAAIESAQAGTFKRHGDPRHGGCTYRSGGDCASIGVRMHCKLETGHDYLLGHAYDDNGCTAQNASGPCAGPGLCHESKAGVAAGPCAQPREAHGTPHAMEVSSPYVLKVEGRA